MRKFCHCFQLWESRLNDLSGMVQFHNALFLTEELLLCCFFSGFVFLKCNEKFYLDSTSRNRYLVVLSEKSF